MMQTRARWSHLDEQDVTQSVASQGFLGGDSLEADARFRDGREKSSAQIVTPPRILHHNAHQDTRWRVVAAGNMAMHLQQGCQVCHGRGPDHIFLQDQSARSFML